MFALDERLKNAAPNDFVRINSINFFTMLDHLIL